MATKIVGIEGMSSESLNQELQKGGKFVMFEYCISIVLMSFKRFSRPESIGPIKKGTTIH